MTAWVDVTLGEICDKPQYGAIAKGTDEPVGPRFVRQQDLVDGSINWATVPYCDLEQQHVHRYALAKDDLLVARLGSIGRASRVRDPNGAIFAGYLVRFRVKSDLVDAAFIGYQLLSPWWWQHVEAVRSGAVQPTLNAKQMAAFRFQLPPIAEQRRIAATLGALDDKIDSSRRLAGLIPNLIRAYVTDALTAGTRDVAVAELASYINGGAFTKGAVGTGRIVIRISELNSGPGGSTVYSDIDVPDEKTARAGDILMSWSGSLGVYRWFRDEAIINQHIFKVVPAGDFPAWLVFDRLDSVMPIFRGIAKDKATTMGHIQRGHLKSTLVSVPSVDSIAALNQALEPLWRRLLVADRENVRLKRLRDVLLSELLAGRIRVSEAVDAMGAAA